LTREAGGGATREGLTWTGGAGAGHDVIDDKSTEMLAVVGAFPAR